MNLRYMGRALLAFLLLLVLAACGLPDELVTRAKSYPDRFAALQKEVASDKGKYEATASQESWTFYKVYADREKWAASFDTASSEITRAKGLYDSKVVPILNENKPEREAELTALLDQLDLILKGVKTESGKPSLRMTFLSNAREKASVWTNEARDNRAAIDKLVAAIAPEVERTKVDYPQRATDIDALFAPLTLLKSQVQTELGKIDAEFAKHESGQPADYSVLGDGVQFVASSKESATLQDTDIRTKLGEIYQSYTKILIDMREEYWITVGRTSWDESELVEFPSETSYTYPPVMVTPEAFSAFVALGEQPFANYSCFFSCGMNVSSIDQKIVDQLHIDPKAGNWPGFDNSAEYDVADDDAKYFHKYLLVKNGEKTETDWIEVDEEDYPEFADDLGMEIESKPYGVFASETLSEPSPAGMSYVGNEKYGEWKTDQATGTSFWQFYGQYAFFRDMFGGPYYSRGIYDDWNTNYRGRAGYYGANPNQPDYGTFSTSVRNNRMFQQSTFNKTGGFKAADASLRGAGPGSRNRGPGSGK